MEEPSIARNRVKYESPKARAKVLKMDIEECERVIDQILGLPNRPVQTYFQKSKERERKRDKLKWMRIWHGDL